MKKLLILISILICSCQTPKNSNSGWQKVFVNDANGKSIFGDKSKLIDAVRLGYPVRIGWGSARVEHVADADFLTLFKGEEVFGQIKSITGQAPVIEDESLKIRFRKQNHWTKIAGTNGFSTGLMTHYFKDSIVSGDTDRFTTTTWYVQYPSHQLEIDAIPLLQKKTFEK